MTKFIILCGGIGRRNNSYSLPKPLNYINGRHMIEYIIENIPANDIYIIYNIALAQYNFEEIVINRIKTKKFHFAQVEYLTRGAVETARIGISQFLDNTYYSSNISYEDSVVFLDNDNIHTLSDISNLADNCIGYSKNYDKNRVHYSFITILDNKVINIEEKNKISDDYCCGIYGFKDAATFLDYSSKLILDNNKTKNEFYFSQMYKMMLLDKLDIIPIHITTTSHIGTLEEIRQNARANQCLNTGMPKLRICFDLDNTLVSYPSIPGNYSTVKPIHANINLLKSLKNAGHEIIIYTARRMATHKHNIGKVMKDIALITLESLEALGIEYDEIIFGKPIADIYIDDRAMNPYINDISYFGLMFDKSDYIPNKLDNNKYNTITRKGNQITKSGPYTYMRGELYFYQNISSSNPTSNPTSNPKLNNSSLSLNSLFPALINFNKIDDKLEITLEYINGIPLYYLYKNQLLTEAHIDKLFDILDTLHTTEYPITIKADAIYNNYFKKLEARFNPHDYFFTDADIIYNKIINQLQNAYIPQIASVIHGDFWFSNIMLEYNDGIKCIDMKGQVDGELTLNGDLYYDYGKLYQSILGYDLVLNNCYPSDNNTSATSASSSSSASSRIEYIKKMKTYFLDKCQIKGLDIPYLNAVVRSLIFGTLPFINSNEDKLRIWQFLVSLLVC